MSAIWHEMQIQDVWGRRGISMQSINETFMYVISMKEFVTLIYTDMG